MQLLTALGGMGAFSGAASAVERDDEQGEGGDEGDDGDLPVGTEPLLQYLAVTYGDLLDEDELARLEDDVADVVRTAERIDEVDLENGDDMALTFEPYRGSY